MPDMHVMKKKNGPPPAFVQGSLQRSPSKAAMFTKQGSMLRSKDVGPIDDGLFDALSQVQTPAKLRVCI